MALVVITSAAVTTPAMAAAAAAAAVVLTLRRTWHNLQAQARAGAAPLSWRGHPIRHLDTQPCQQLQYIQLFIMLLYCIA